MTMTENDDPVETEPEEPASWPPPGNVEDWPLEVQLEFYREMFFDTNHTFIAFYDLPYDHQKHIVARCRELMAQLGPDSAFWLPEPVRPRPWLIYDAEEQEQEAAHG